MTEGNGCAAQGVCSRPDPRALSFHCRHDCCIASGCYEQGHDDKCGNKTSVYSPLKISRPLRSASEMVLTLLHIHKKRHWKTNSKI